MGLYIFDLFGTFAFAVSGVLLGIKKNMDAYGCLVLASVAAVGGGTVRDIMLDSPPFILSDVNYLAVIAASFVIVLLFKPFVERKSELLMAADAVGLGVFTVIGAIKGIDAGLKVHGVFICAVLTGTGGGMLRDILAGDVPFVLTREVYASACIAGALLFILLCRVSFPEAPNMILTACLVTFIRIFTYKKGYHLPKYT